MSTDNKIELDYIGAKNDQDLEALITSIYHKCRLQLSNDDPLLLMYHVNCFMAGRLEYSLRQVAEEYNRRMVELVGQVNADTKEKAETIINKAIDVGAKVVENAMNDSANAVRKETESAIKAVNAVRSDTEKAVVEMLDKIKFADVKVQKRAYFALIVSIIAGFGGVGALAMTLIRMWYL